jgi:hypothetical protein
MRIDEFSLYGTQPEVTSCTNKIGNILQSTMPIGFFSGPSSSAYTTFPDVYLPPLRQWTAQTKKRISGLASSGGHIVSNDWEVPGQLNAGQQLGDSSDEPHCGILTSDHDEKNPRLLV